MKSVKFTNVTKCLCVRMYLGDWM